MMLINIPLTLGKYKLDDKAFPMAITIFQDT